MPACPHQKHVDVDLDSKLDFSIHIELEIKFSKIIGLIGRLFVCVPRKARLTINKSFATSHLNYGDILYHKPGNANFKFEKVQYKACIAITVDIQGISTERVNDELGSISCSKKRWYKKSYFLL